MKPDKLADLIGMIDDDMLVLAEKMRSGIHHEARKRGMKMEKRRRWVRNGLLAAAVVAAVGLCLFASRYKLNEQYPIQLGTGEAETTEEVTNDIEEELTISETAAAEQEKMDVVHTGFENAQSIIDYGQYRFDVGDTTELLYINGSVLSVSGPDGSYEITDKLRNGGLAAKGNMLYYATMEDEEYHLMELNMDTLESRQLYARPVEMINDECESTFLIKGISGEYLIYSMGHPTRFSVEVQQIYSYSLKDGGTVALSAGEKTELDGNGEYIASIHSEAAIPGILHVNRLTLDKLDGSDSRVLSELCTGIEIEGDILYYIEWAEGNQYLVTYDMNQKKELSRMNVSTDEEGEWGQKYGSFVRGNTEVLLTNGEIYTYPYGYISKLKNQYFFSELGSKEKLTIYRINENDGTLTAIENEMFDKENDKFAEELRLHNGRVYTKLYQQNKKEICSWSWDVFDAK